MADLADYTDSVDSVGWFIDLADFNIPAEAAGLSELPDLVGLTDVFLLGDAVYLICCGWFL